jgi:hypothetical protein
LCVAQGVSVPEGYEAKENLRDLGSAAHTGSVKTFDNRYEGVKGTPYVFEAWMPGEVYMSSKRKVAVKELNYNCFDNEIVYRDPATGIPRLLNRHMVDLFVIKEPGASYTFVPVQLKSDADPVFARVLYNQGSMVYEVYSKEFLKANYEGGYSADRRYDQFVDKRDFYFMKRGEKTLYRVKKSKKYMIGCFAGKEKEISGCIKSNKLNLKDEGDIVKLLEYHDSL